MSSIFMLWKGELSFSGPGGGRGADPYIAPDKLKFLDFKLIITSQKTDFGRRTKVCVQKKT
jgi:hypothetical protein